MLPRTWSSRRSILGLTRDREHDIAPIDATFLAKVSWPPCLVLSASSCMPLHCLPGIIESTSNADILMPSLDSQRLASSDYTKTCTALRHIPKIPQDLAYLRRRSSTIQDLSYFLRFLVFCFTVPDRLLVSFSQFISSIRRATGKLVKIGDHTMLYT